MKWFYLICCLLGCCLIPRRVSAQHSFHLRLVASDRDSSFFHKAFSYQQSFPDTFSRWQEVRRIFTLLSNQSYFLARADSLSHDSANLVCYITVGALVTWARLARGNVPQAVLDRAGYREKFYDGMRVDAETLRKLEEKLLVNAENNGYPFAQVGLDSLRWEGKTLFAALHYLPGNLITFDSIEVIGDARINRHYLTHYIGIGSGTVYNEETVQHIDARLRELPYLQQQKAYVVVFHEHHATLKLWLQHKQSSRFDAVLGVLPNNEVSGKLLITGEGTMNLQNTLGQGEQMSLVFNKYEALSTRLTAKLVYPYLFSLPFGADLDFELYKHDTTWLDVQQDAGVRYFFSNDHHIEGFVHAESSSLLSVDTNYVLAYHQLPANLDVRKVFYGITYSYTRLDYKYNPRKGIDLQVSASTGVRQIRRNTAFTRLKDPNDPGFDFSSLYDSLASRAQQYRLDLRVAAYWPIARHSCVLTEERTSGMLGHNLLRNELLQIGGNRILRGYDEESLPASWYNLGTIEYHYLLSVNSYVYGFGDFAYLYNPYSSLKQPSPYVGFGAGITFETKAGIFGVNYALGKAPGNPVDLRAAKIHFGYLNYF